MTIYFKPIRINKWRQISNLLNLFLRWGFQINIGRKQYFKQLSFHFKCMMNFIARAGLRQNWRLGNACLQFRFFPVFCSTVTRGSFLLHGLWVSQDTLLRCTRTSCSLFFLMSKPFSFLTLRSEFRKKPFHLIAQ